MPGGGGGVDALRAGRRPAGGVLVGGWELVVGAGEGMAADSAALEWRQAGGYGLRLWGGPARRHAGVARLGLGLACWAISAVWATNSMK
jgi:hypothetical protein